MTDAELAARLAEALVSAQQRYRTAPGQLGAITSNRVPDRFFDEVAAGLAPVLRALVADAVAQQVTR